MIWKRNISQATPHIKSSDSPFTSILNKVGLPGLGKQVPGFYVNSKQVDVILEPQLFYQKLLEKCQNASRRIVLASLYIGTNMLSEKLVSAIYQRMKEKPEMQVKILIDCTRGSRGVLNSRKILLPLLKDHEQSCQVSLFHTPSLQGSLHRFLPDRYREILGVQHIKAYIFDDDLIISGANLSYTYFTNRQDRYMLINNCKELTDFIEGLVDKISECSFLLDKDDVINLHKDWNYHPIESNSKVYSDAAAKHILNYYNKHIGLSGKDTDDTIIFPLLEMGPFNIHIDSAITTELLKGCNTGCKLDLATAYFNLTRLYTDTIICRSKASFRVLMSHPTNNSFYNAKGPAGGIPSAYTRIATQFFKKVKKARQCQRIKLYEFVRPDWTFHSKGLWLTLPGNSLPCVTLIGSPNFGERSIMHDLECQFLLLTTGKELQKSLSEERDFVFNSSTEFTTEVMSDPTRRCPFWVKIVVWLFRSYL